MPWCEGMPRASVAVWRAGGVLRQACQPPGGPVPWSRGVLSMFRVAVSAEEDFSAFWAGSSYVAQLTKRLLIKPLSRFIYLFRSAILCSLASCNLVRARRTFPPVSLIAAPQGLFGPIGAEVFDRGWLGERPCGRHRLGDMLTRSAGGEALLVRVEEWPAGLLGLEPLAGRGPAGDRRWDGLDAGTACWCRWGLLGEPVPDGGTSLRVVGGEVWSPGVRGVIRGGSDV